MADALDRHPPHHWSPWRRRLRWVAVVVFAFLAFEGVLFALALQGPWLVLLAPGLVCGFKAAETYRERPRGTADSIKLMTKHPGSADTGR